MRKQSYIAVTVILIVTALNTACFIKTKKQMESLDEFASFMALDLLFIHDDLRREKVEDARRKIEDSIEISNRIKKKNGYDSQYWKMFDFYLQRLESIPKP
jgi:hypothetical protein